MSDVDLESFVVGEQLQATKYYVTAMLVVLLYEHALTLSDEVKYVWSRNPTLGNLLFYVSRYYTPIVLSICVGSLLSPTMSDAKLAPIQPLGLLTVALVVSGTLLLLRIYALYNRSAIVLTYLGSLLAAQVAVSIYLFTFPGSTVFPLPPIDLPVFHGCLYIPSPRLGLWASSVLVLELVYDVSVFSLIALKAWRTMSFNTLGLNGLMYLLIKDGALYFIVIFTIVLIWFLMDMLAPPGLKCINALPASAMVVVMINRLTINLHRTLKTPYMRDMTCHDCNASEAPIPRWMLDSRSDGTSDEIVILARRGPVPTRGAKESSLGW